jgi:hypothetical protein
MQGGMSGNMMVVGTISHKAPWACASEVKQKVKSSKYSKSLAAFILIREFAL